jgi:hypothetical protein
MLSDDPLPTRRQVLIDPRIRGDFTKGCGYTKAKTTPIRAIPKAGFEPSFQPCDL